MRDCSLSSLLDDGALEEIDLLTSWDALRSPRDPNDDKDAPELEKHDLDGTDEVEADLNPDFEG